MLRLERIDVTFNKGGALENRALREVDGVISNGQFVTVIGSNGAGKSTLLNVIAGELVPDSGRVLVDGRDITRWPVHRRAPLIARMFQDPRAGICEDMSILENLAIAAARTSPRGIRVAINPAFRREATDRVAVLGLGLENRLHDRVALLSGGQRQALCLVMATFGATKVLLLDEHTAALDPAAAELVMNLTDRIVRTLGITSVMVTHSMRQALEFGDRTLMLSQGRIILDISGPSRASMTVEGLVDLFRRKEGTEVTDDELLLS
jgi:putative ABC transport system ATP-binding protein